VATAAAIAADRADTRDGIVVIGPVPPPYHGGAVATSYVLSSDVSRHWRVLHLDISDRRGLENIGRLEPGNVVLALRHATAFLRLLVVQRPALVYLALAQNTLAVLRDATFILPALMLRRRVVIHLHAGGFRSYYENASGPVQWLLRFMLSRATRVIVLGEALRDSVAGLIDAQRVAVLPNGTADTFAAMPQRAQRTGPVRVLFLGNLMREKGVFEVIAAVKALRSEDVDIELDIAGGHADDRQRVELQDTLAPLGAAVCLHDVVDGERKRALLARADIFAFPSWYSNEAHPYVVLEAMSAGLPIVATPRAALRETVVDGETGVLVAERDPAALVSALRRLATDPAMRLQMGAAARRRFEEHYSLGDWSSGLCRILTEALA
jgi:glycosyltransferase involved in cell wall biosynthesis